MSGATELALGFAVPQSADSPQGTYGIHVRAKRSLERAALSVLRTLDPELAHDLGLRALRYGIVPKIPYAPSPILKSEVFGLAFPTPVGIAAGFDKNAEAVDAASNLPGLGFMEVGTVTPLSQSGNPRPRLFRLRKDRAIVNRMGFNSHGVSVVKRRLERASSQLVVGVNIGANRDSENLPNDYRILIKELYTVAGYFTINISSPNTRGLRSLHEAVALSELLDLCCKERESCKSLIGYNVPLLLKVSPDLSDEAVEVLCDVIDKYPIDGLVATNTTVARDSRLLGENSSEIGGLSGAPLFDMSTRIVQLLYRFTGGRVPIIGVGGIGNAKQAYEKIRSGASLVQLYTALVYDGPSLVASICSGLEFLLKNDGFASISEAVGVDVAPQPAPLVARTA